MDTPDFEKLKNRFLAEDLDGKIDIYISSEGLNTDQYKDLLRVFPLGDLHKLEKALA